MPETIEATATPVTAEVAATNIMAAGAAAPAAAGTPLATQAQAAERRVAEIAAKPAPVPVSDTSRLVTLIERMALDPNSDVTKMERLVDLFMKLRADAALHSFIRAMAEMQGRLPEITREGRIVIHKKDAPKTPENEIQSTPYARFEDINAAVMPVLNAHGFTMNFKSKRDSDRVIVTGILGHVDGHREESVFEMPLDTTGSKNNNQAVGSSFSYGKRYAMIALLNINSRAAPDRDDDAEATGPRKISEEQVAALQDLIDQTGTDNAKFCKAMKVEAVADILVKDYGQADKLLRQKLTKATAAAAAPAETAAAPAGDKPKARR